MFIPFQAIGYFHSQFQPLASISILATFTIKLQFPPSTTNLPDLYLNLHLLHPYCLVASFLPLKYVCKLEPFILQWEEKIDTKCHIQHFGIIDQIHNNLNHIR